MKILVVSDSHGYNTKLAEIIRKTRPFDHLIHAGDTDGFEDEIRRMADCPCSIVRGNNDYYTDLPREMVFELCGVRFFLTHGHELGVHYGTERLAEEARKRGCRVAVFGHTHRPMIDDTAEDLALINPGSVTYPRQEGRLPSYIVIDIDRHGAPHFHMNYLKGRTSLW